jgi:hypothetical protein
VSQLVVCLTAHATAADEPSNEKNHSRRQDAAPGEGRQDHSEQQHDREHQYGYIARPDDRSCELAGTEGARTHVPNVAWLVLENDIQTSHYIHEASKLVPHEGRFLQR